MEERLVSFIQFCFSSKLQETFAILPALQNSSSTRITNMADVDYITCEDCGTLVPERNLAIHQARACGGRARASAPHEEEMTEEAAEDETAADRDVIDISGSPPPAKRPSQQENNGIPRRRQRTSGADVLQDFVDLTSAPDTPIRAPATTNAPTPATTNHWSCPKCTLLNLNNRSCCDACQYSNPDVRGPDPTRSERLINDDFESWSNHNHNRPSNNNNDNSPRSNSALRNVGGGALLGSLLGGAASYMRGRSVADGMVEGAMTGAVGGAIADSVLSPARNLPATRSSAVMGHPGYPSLTAPARPRSSLRREPRASMQVRRHLGGNGVMTTTVIRSDGISTQRTIRPGNEDPLLSLMMANILGRGGSQHNNIDRMGYEQLLQAFGDGTENMGADECDIQSLPISKLSDVLKELPEGDARRCCICLEDFENGETRKTLPCLHGFHADCIDKALRNRGFCPICNSSLKP